MAHLHHKHLPSFIDEHGSHDVSHRLLENRTKVRLHRWLDPLGQTRVILLGQAEVAELMQLLVGLALKQVADLGVDSVHVLMMLWRLTKTARTGTVCTAATTAL